MVHKQIILSKASPLTWWAWKAFLASLSLPEADELAPEAVPGHFRRRCTCLPGLDSSSRQAFQYISQNVFPKGSTFF